MAGDAAAAFPLRPDGTADQQTAILVRGVALLLQRRTGRAGEIGEQRRNIRPFAASADNFAADPLPQHRIDGVDDHGFARAGFTGQHIQPLFKGDLCLFNDGDILDVQSCKHASSPLFRPLNGFLAAF